MRQELKGNICCDELNEFKINAQVKMDIFEKGRLVDSTGFQRNVITQFGVWQALARMFGTVDNQYNDTFPVYPSSSLYTLKRASGAQGAYNTTLWPAPLNEQFPNPTNYGARYLLLIGTLSEAVSEVCTYNKITAAYTSLYSHALNTKMSSISADYGYFSGGIIRWVWEYTTGDFNGSFNAILTAGGSTNGYPIGSFVKFAEAKTKTDQQTAKLTYEYSVTLPT